MTVEPSSAAAERVHEGQTFYFCAVGCAERFEKDPKRYLSPSLKGQTPAKVAPSPHPAGRSLRETRPSVAAGAEVSGGRPRREPTPAGEREQTGAALRGQGGQVGLPAQAAGLSPSRRAAGAGDASAVSRRPRHRGDALRLLRRDHRGRPVGGRRSLRGRRQPRDGTRGRHRERPEPAQADRGRALERLRSEARRGGGTGSGRGRRRRRRCAGSCGAPSSPPR